MFGTRMDRGPTRSTQDEPYSKPRLPMASPSESHRLLSRFCSCDPGSSGCPQPTPGSKILQSFCATVWLIQPGSASQNLSVQLSFQTELLLPDKTCGFYGDFGDSDRERATPDMQGISQKMLFSLSFQRITNIDAYSTFMAWVTSLWAGNITERTPGIGNQVAPR